MIENNTKTTLAMDKIYFEDPTEWEDYLFDNTEYAMELDARNPVLEGAVERLNQLGIQDLYEIPEIQKPVPFLRTEKPT